MAFHYVFLKESTSGDGYILWNLREVYFKDGKISIKMARPRKNNADYFSHDAGMRNDPKVRALRRSYGAEGYSTWCMILELLTESENFRYQWNDLAIELISGDFCIDSARLREIVEYMILLQLLSFEDNLIFSTKLIARFSGLMAKRSRDYQFVQQKTKVNSQFVDVSDNEKTVTDVFPTTKTLVNVIIADDNPQSKVKKSIVNKMSIAFEDFWKKYPGTKSGAVAEYENFLKKNKQDMIPHLMPGLEKEIKHRELLRANKKFEPNWKNLSTWINNRCWEQELPEIKEKNTDGRPIRPSKQHVWSESQQKWIVL